MLFESEEGARDAQPRPWSGTGPMVTKSPQHLLAKRKDIYIAGGFLLEFNFVTLTSPLFFLTLLNFKWNVAWQDRNVN